MNFAEYLYSKKIDPFTIALSDDSELEKLKKEWQKSNNLSNTNTNVERDMVFERLSKLNMKVDNNKLVKVVSKMTSSDTEQTNNVGSWIYYCLINNHDKADKAKQKVTEKYQQTIEKYLDSFIKMLGN